MPKYITTDEELLTKNCWRKNCYRLHPEIISPTPDYVAVGGGRAADRCTLKIIPPTPDVKAYLFP
jgi:hypothetical protein